MSEKIFAGEQFFHQDVNIVKTTGDAVSNKTFGPFDLEEMHGRIKFVAEVFKAGEGTGTGQEVSVKLQGSKDGGTTWVDRVTGTVTTNASGILESGTFLDYIEADPGFKKGKVIVNVAANISGAEIKCGLVYA